MTDAELYTIWFIGLAIAVVVVLIAAGLLIAILLTARSIRGHAQRALAAVEQIAEDTAVIWALDDTNSVAGDLLATVESIEEHGGRIAGALHSQAASTGPGQKGR
jgi:NAD(P)-dependent dehydrogenase (short-subunit alcohol dehydrogenase family)